MKACNCASDWRLEAIDLATGARVRYLPFTQFNFDDLLNQVGPGSVTIPVRKVSAADVWPHTRAIAFTRTAGPGASKAQPVCEMIGMIETIDAESSSTVNVGLQSIDNYLNHRIIELDTTYTSQPQTAVGAALASFGGGAGGIPISATNNGGPTMSITYLAADDKVVMQAISELTQMDDGPDYTRSYLFAAGTWSTTLNFLNTAGNQVPRSLNALRGLTAYGLNVDGTDHANWIRGRGDDSIPPVTVDATVGSIYPRFDKGVQWSDVKDSGVLTSLTNGAIVNSADPTAIPDVTIADLNLSAGIGLGDLFTLTMNHGAIIYDGVARVVGKSWSLADEQPPLCTLSLVAVDPVSTAILAAMPKKPGCC